MARVSAFKPTVNTSARIKVEGIFSAFEGSCQAMCVRVIPVFQLFTKYIQVTFDAIDQIGRARYPGRKLYDFFS